MSEMSDTAKARPVYRNIHISDIASYRLPLAGRISILHRISGAIMFLLLPFVIWMFDTSVSSQVSYDTFASAFDRGLGVLPGWFVKLVALALIWADLHHFVAGIRHMVMDAWHTVSKEQGRNSAIVTLVISIALTLLLGAKLFGVY